MLAAGEGARARIHAVLLAVPEIAPEGMAELARAAALRKDNPASADQPRNPAGGPEGGQWTSDGDEGRQARNVNVHPTAGRTTDVQVKKERFVEAHLADAQTAANQLGVPVENILGLSALESTWGEHRFAAQGNNYFGIHYPAPFANGYMVTKDNRTKVATFANYADSLKSFVAISGSIVQGKRDPEAFATALQNSGRFGIHPITGAKIPTYVGEVARTVRGIRLIVARRRI